MIVHLGRDVVVPVKDIVAVFDARIAAAGGFPQTAAVPPCRPGSALDETPASVVLCAGRGPSRAYPSPLSPAALRHRLAQVRRVSLFSTSSMGG